VRRLAAVVIDGPRAKFAAMPSGSALLRTQAPAAADALDGIVAATWTVSAAGGVLDLVAEAARITAAIHELDPLEAPVTTGAPSAGADTTAVLTFAEQCSTDVAAVTPDQRAAFLRAAGPAAADLAAALWVVDFIPRTRAALDALAGAGQWPLPEDDGAGSDLWGALDGLIRTVPALDALDPVTSELVRLRGARQHDCRLCRSLRSRPALLAGADESTFAAVDHHRVSDLSPLARGALVFTDAMIWTPGRIGVGTVTALCGLATPAQQVELVLDVTRNALNKIAVALGADAAHVEDGVEIYDVEPDGSLVYGLTLD
jgi:alkylhydroperoxidase family enzyme